MKKKMNNFSVTSTIFASFWLGFNVKFGFKCVYLGPQLKKKKRKVSSVNLQYLPYFDLGLMEIWFQMCLFRPPSHHLVPTKPGSAFPWFLF